MNLIRSTAVRHLLTPLNRSVQHKQSADVLSVKELRTSRKPVANTFQNTIFKTIMKQQCQCYTAVQIGTCNEDCDRKENTMPNSRLTEDCLRTRSNGCGLDRWICFVISECPKLSYLTESTLPCGNEWVEWAEMWASDMTPLEALKEYERVYIGTPHIQEYIAPENNTGYEPTFDE